MQLDRDLGQTEIMADFLTAYCHLRMKNANGIPKYIIATVLVSMHPINNA